MDKEGISETMILKLRFKEWVHLAGWIIKNKRVKIGQSRGKSMCKEPEKTAKKVQ